MIGVRSPFLIVFNMALFYAWKCLIFSVLLILEYGNCARSAVDASSYMKICHRSDPQLNRCMKESIEELRPFLVKGIPELHIPPFEPLIISEINMNQGKGSMNLQTTYRNLHMWGISQFELKDFHACLDKNQFHFRIMFPKLVTKAQYEINGKILMLPINGNGTKEGNYTNVEGNVLVQGSRLRFNDTTYFHVDNVLIDVNVGRVRIHFNNLFNGDRELGDAMNTVINDNWRHVLKDMRPVLEQAIGEVIKGLFNTIYNRFPLEVLLPY